MKHRNRMFVTAALLAALLAGCGSTSEISLEEAKAIAYAHAGVSESEALDKSYETDDGMYEIDFEFGGYEYEYDISYGGEILKARKTPEKD